MPKGPGSGTPAPKPSGDWWVVWIVDSSRSGRLQPYAIEQAASAAAADQVVANAGNVLLNTDGPFPSRAAAQADVHKKTKKGAIAVNATPVIKGLTGGGLGLSALWQDFLSALTKRSTVLRIAEGLLGGALIVVGVAKLGSSNPTVQKVSATALKVGKAAAIL